MIINQQPPSSGGGGGAAEWTDISSAVGSDGTAFSVAVCETDGTYVHVMGSIVGQYQEVYIEGYPPKEDISANMYKLDPSGSLSVSGTVLVYASDHYGTPSAYVYAPNGAGAYTAFSIVYPIAT